MVLITLLILLLWVVLLAIDASAGADYNVWLGGGRELPPLLGAGGVFAPAVARGEWWRLLAAGFLHAGVFHLVASALGLLLVGAPVVRRYGAPRFLAIYAAGAVAGNVLASVSSQGTGRVTVGASGAVLGLAGALLLVAYRFRSQAHTMTVPMCVIVGSLVYGLFHANVSNEGHVGGLVGGLAAARVLGPSRRWAAETAEWDEKELRESLAHEEELRRRLVLPNEPFAPEHVRVLPLSPSAARRSRLMGALLLLGLGVAALASRDLLAGQAPAGPRELLIGAVVAVLCGGGGIALLAQAAGGDLTLTPAGFKVRGGGRSRHTRWIDAQGFYPTEIHGTHFVQYALTPAAQVRLTPTDWRRLLWDGSGSIPAHYGDLTAAQLSDLMNDWRRRWAVPPPPAAGDPPRTATTRTADTDAEQRN